VSTSPKHISTAALAGGLAGGICGVILFAVMGFLLRRSHRERYRKQDIIDSLIVARGYEPVPEDAQSDISDPPPYVADRRVRFYGVPSIISRA